MDTSGKAKKTETAFRMECAVSINVRAKARTVWTLLTNAAEFPKWNSDFHWRIFVSAQLSDDPISYDLTGVASARDKCGQPGSANWFTADWVMH